MSDPEKALALEMYREECKIRIRAVAAMREEYPKIYAFLLGQMSEQSKARVKTSSNWADIERDNDPEALWVAILNIFTWRLSHSQLQGTRREHGRRTAKFDRTGPNLWLS